MEAIRIEILNRFVTIVVFFFNSFHVKFHFILFPLCLRFIIFRYKYIVCTLLLFYKVA